MTKRLRIARIIIQPIIVWDDDEEISPGPELDAMASSFAKLGEFVEQFRERFPTDLADLEARLLAQEAAAAKATTAPPNREQRRAAARKKP